MATPTSARTQALAAPERPSVALGERGIALRSLDDLGRAAEMMAIGLGHIKPGMDDHQRRVAIARLGARIATGMEAGLSMAYAARGLLDVNGRVAWYGETLRGLLYSRGAVDPRDESALQLYVENAPPPGTPPAKWADDVAGVAKIRRVGWRESKVVRFTVGAAKVAALWGKDGPWRLYPDRMLEERAFGFWCRRFAADITMNLPLVGEAEDISSEPAQSPVSVAVASPAAPALATRDPFEALADSQTLDAEILASETPVFDSNAARAELVAEIAARTDPSARADVEREVLGSAALTTPAEVTAARERIEEHRAVMPAQAELFDDGGAV